jgi:RNA-directed DNA polymerase
MKPFHIRTKEELARLLAVGPFEIDQVMANRRMYYRSFKRLKSDGTFRVLYNPQGPLKLLHQKVKRNIIDLAPVLGCVHGGVRGRSVITNARLHVNKDIVFCLDIKDFYPSVRPTVVCTIFEYLGFGSEVAHLLTDITTWDNQLPQGVATSTGLANLSMTRVDVRLQALADKQGFAYSRWVDDLTISGSRRLLDFRRLIQRIVTEEGFVIKPEKLRTMHSGMRQVVAGVVVNRKPNVPKEDRKLIRQCVFQFRASRRRDSTLLDHIRGKISWLSQVNPNLGCRLAKKLPLVDQR